MFGNGLRTALGILAALAFALAAGCGEGSDESAYYESRAVASDETFAAMDAPMAGNPGNPGPSMSVMEVVREVEVEMVDAIIDAPPAQPTPAPMSMTAAAPAGGVDIPAPEDIRARYASVQRVIVRTARVDLVVDAIQPSLDAIGQAAEGAGGWVVSTNRASKHSGTISVRVPAAELDDFIETLRGMAAEVISETTDSQDVTDEYVDLRSRMDGMLATQARLLEFLDLAPDARQALEVQRDLSELQLEIERVSGRIKLLEETSAFSLATVNLTLAAQDMRVDAGPDRTEAAGRPIRFRATFAPPAGVTDFSATWDFGDGSPPVTVYRDAPTTTDGERVTETVTHFYEDPTDSPFIVSVALSGTGEGGVAEGEDTLIASVSRIPQIQLYAGDGWLEVEQNDEALFAASFTRPEGLRNVRYEWDFGDGSPPSTGELPEGVTRIEAAHIYPDYRDIPYTARLAVTADSDAGMTSATAEVSVSVRRERGFIVAGYDLGETFKTAVRALSVAVQGAGTLLVWAVVFSPIIAALGAAVWLIIRLDARARARRLAAMEARRDAESAAANRDGEAVP